MEKRRLYKKPDFKVVSVISKQDMASACWSLTGTTTEGANPHSHNYSGPFYHDFEGPGYMSFWVKHKNPESGCSSGPDAFDIEYYNGGSASDFSETQLEALLLEKGGSDGEPYSGMLSDFPYVPNEMS